MTGSFDRQSLRQQLRVQRNSLTPKEQWNAAQAVAAQLTQQSIFVRGNYIAIYWPNDGEVDLRPLAEKLWQMKKRIYLPVLHPSQPRQLWFCEWTPNSSLSPNKFGIPEPDYRTEHKIAPHLLNTVLVPLVGFDRSGARLGMGGGYYDSTFSFLNKKAGKPLLIGVAHHCQEVEKIEAEHWDIKMHAMVTDKEWLEIKENS